MIDLGVKEDEYNFKYGVAIGEVVDTVYLVGEQQTAQIGLGLKQQKFTGKTIICNTFTEAFTKMSKVQTSGTVLIANDLPDKFTE